jgi:hypothetical protein
MFKKKTPLPVPLDRWFTDIKAVEDLRAIIDSESFQTAVATLKSMAAPTFATLSDGDTNSLRHAWYAGYCDFVADLQKLTKLPVKNYNETNTEWTHIQQNQ